MLVPHGHGQSPQRCQYCGQPLQPRFYFCTACAMPHTDVEAVLPEVRPAQWDDETRVRKLAPEVWRLFFAYLGALLGATILGFLIHPVDEGGVPGLIIGLLSVAVVSTVFGWLHRDVLRPQFAGLGLLSPIMVKGLLGLAGLLLVNLLWHGALWNLASEELRKDMYKDVTGLVPMVAARVFLICVMPAFFEEIGFRGLVQTWLMRVIDPWKAVALSAALFSAIHFSVLSSPYLFLVGALLAWTRWKSGLLFPGILLHFLHNLAVLWYEGLLT